MNTHISKVFVITLGLLSAASARLSAQAYSGVGDPAVASGNPASSYTLTGIDHVNYYNGAVNFTIPLYVIGGRGNASQPIATTIQEQWSVAIISSSFVPENFPQYSGGGMYTGGTIGFGTTNTNPTGCVTYVNGQPQYSPSGPFLGYVTWTKMDGTVVHLRDLKSNGQSQNVACGGTMYDRGTIFQSSDGTDATFVASADVHDGQASVTGTVRTKDGTQYIFSGSNNDSYQTGMEDRNGNQIQFVSTTSGYNITDSAGRSPTIGFSTSNSNPQDTIGYKGYNNNPRAVTVSHGLLQNSLAPGESLQTLSCLFPELQGSTSTKYNPYVVSSVTLADGSAYTVQYNAYGEPSRLTLPTGGVYAYEYPEANCAANGSSGVLSMGSNGGYVIRRMVQERDEYANGGSTLTGKTLYSWGSSGSNGDPNFPARATTIATVTFEDQNSTVLRTEKHYFWGSTSPAYALSGASNQFADWWLGMEYRTDVSDPASGTLQSTTRAYAQRPCPGAGETVCPNGQSSENMTVDSAPPHDPQLCQANTLLNSSSLSTVAYTYDQYNNPTNEYDFDFGAGLPLNGTCPTSFTGELRHTQTSYLTNNATGTYTAAGTNILALPNDIQIMNSAGTVYSHTTLGYDENAISNAPNIVGHDNSNYAGNGIRGNLTTVKQYLNTSNSWLTSQIFYDIAGNVVMTTDPLNHSAKLFYTDNYTSGSQNSYAHVTSATNAAGEGQSWEYDYGLGKPVTYTNTNGKATQYQYGVSGFSIDRLTQALNPDSSQLNYRYPSATEVDSNRDQLNAGDNLLVTVTNYDGLGRSTSVEQSDDSGSGYIATTTNYDALGRVLTTRNPSRSGDGLNYTTTYGYDGLGRIKMVTTADNNVAGSSYSGNQVTQTDQLGRARQFAYDGLGRLSVVVEDPSVGTSYTGNNFQTVYAYDPLGDLICVNQGGTCGPTPQGGRSRTFGYDTLGRQTTATNVESGTMNYTYYNSGMLNTKTDARGRVTTNSYDALNRITGSAYSDGTPSVTYTWGAAGGVTNSIDQLTKISNSNSTMNYTSFDVIGRPTASNQLIQTAAGSQTYNFSNYTYYVSGALKSETYPSGRVVTTSYDGANRVLGVSGVMNGATTPYLSNVNYWPHGEVFHSTRANTLWSLVYYNNRLQPVQTSEALNNNGSQNLAGSCLDWGTQSSTACSGQFSTSLDNGTLKHRFDWAGGPGALGSLTAYSHNYSYDALNRLLSDADSGGASRTMGYDQWGNMATTGGAVFSGLTPSNVSAFNANNRLSSSLFTYDSAGNMTGLGSIGINYDANNRQISTNDSSLHVQVGYSYDGLGNRVTKTVTNGPTTVYVYDALGQMTAEYTNASSAPPCMTCYPSYDQLGSVRMVTDQNGKVVARHDYVPFGEEVPGGNYGRSSQFGASDGVSQRFTGQERDAENTPSMDYFNARYMVPVLGRFASSDPGNTGAVLTNPQSWNGYSYVLNNPLANVDPTGTCTNGNPDQDGDTLYDIVNLDGDGNFVSQSFGCASTLPSGPDLTGATLPTISSTDAYAGGQGGSISSTQNAFDNQWAGALFLVGQNTDAQQAFIGKVVGGSALVGAGGAFAPSAVSGTVGLAARGIGWAQGTFGAGSGIVIGAYDAASRYTDAARSLGANYFSLPAPVWNAVNYFGQAWSANRAFLDASIARGQQVLLSSNPQEAERYYLMELEYLTARGVGPDQWEMVQFPIKQVGTMSSLP